ncbi:hypothetical protein G3578_09770 [Brevibacillus sp. SYP-B805]|uniref:hypothetical protein n=1 Tax=Brevibacillus sp. SYP-B805 TaxID=1578199 RepID=UPI0013EB76DE|nr:hypothetical protein [Brevibacillus sp. SYP-B805]NGQ95440.1 hypothetical protein [Brevibacillus sp. SYP-B805]
MTREDRPTPEVIAAIRERAERATPGPWRWSNAKVLNGKYDFVPQGSYLADTLIMFGDTYENGEHDAEFIAHARTDIPRLLDALEAAYERERKLIDALRWYAKTDNWTEGRLTRIEYPEIVVSVAEEDGGQRASATLKELGIEKGW